MREMISLFAIHTPVCADLLWESWYAFCQQQEQEYGFAFTHVSCHAETLRPNGIRTASRYRKKIEASIRSREQISSLEFYMLPASFHQAVFDFNVYMGLSCGKLNTCEITVENHFLEGYDYRRCLDGIQSFLRLTKAEVNLLPYTQVFNYNMNCILRPIDPPEKHGLIQTLYSFPK